MRKPIKNPLLLVLLLLLVVAVVGYRALDGGRTGAPSSTAAAPTAAAPRTSATPAVGSSVAASPSPAAQARSGSTASAGPTTASAQGKPTVAAAAQAKPTAAAPARPSGSVEVDRAKIVQDAVWSPGQLQSHFEKHGREGPWASESVYDASARETVEIGTVFTYVDRESNAERLGFFDKGGNRFTSLTRDGRRITTHFRPDRGEAYVRSLTRSTYR